MQTTTRRKATPARKKAEKSKAIQEGIKAIIFLQSLAGITETSAQATKGWLSMSDGEKSGTMNAYRVMSQ